uniref:ACR, protein COG1678 n=1 Tax=Toxoplasma gondii COUG TaxID=1074873 RepID=A0A2G8XRN1_TOXGO|nr:ACR, protein COG1678 [Toxoplasma gondii COUG]
MATLRGSGLAAARISSVVFAGKKDSPRKAFLRFPFQCLPRFSDIFTRSDSGCSLNAPRGVATRADPETSSNSCLSLSRSLSSESLFPSQSTLDSPSLFYSRSSFPSGCQRCSAPQTSENFVSLRRRRVLRCLGDSRGSCAADTSPGGACDKDREDLRALSGCSDIDAQSDASAPSDEWRRRPSRSSPPVRVPRSFSSFAAFARSRVCLLQSTWYLSPRPVDAALSPASLSFARSSTGAFSSSAAASTSVSSSGPPTLVLSSVRRLVRLARFLDRHPALVVVTPHLLQLAEERHPASEQFLAALMPLWSPSAFVAGASPLPAPRPPHAPLPPKLARAPAPVREETPPLPLGDSPVLRFFRQKDARSGEPVCAPVTPGKEARLSAPSPVSPLGVSVAQLVCSYIRRDASTRRGKMGGREQLRAEDLEGSLEFIWATSRLFSRLQFLAYDCTRKLHAPLCLLVPPDAGRLPEASVSRPGSLPAGLVSGAPGETPGVSCSEGGAPHARVGPPPESVSSSGAAPSTRSLDLSVDDVRAAHKLEERLVGLLALARVTRDGPVSSSPLSSTLVAVDSALREAETARLRLRDEEEEPCPTQADLDEALDCLLLPPYRFRDFEETLRLSAALHLVRVKPVKPRGRKPGEARERSQAQARWSDRQREEEPSSAEGTGQAKENAVSTVTTQRERHRQETEAVPCRVSRRCPSEENEVETRDDAHDEPLCREQKVGRHPSVLESRRLHAAKEVKHAGSGEAPATALRRGLLLLAHPLICDSWERAVVLVTHVSRRGYVEGVILNKRRAWRPSAWALDVAPSTQSRGDPKSRPASARSGVSALDACRLPENLMMLGDSAGGPISGAALLPGVSPLPASFSNFVAHMPRQLRLLQHARNNLEKALTLSSSVTGSTASCGSCRSELALTSSPSSSPNSAPSQSPPSAALSASPSPPFASLSPSLRVRGAWAEQLLSRASVALAFHAVEAWKAKEATAERLARVVEEMATDLLDAVDFQVSRSTSSLAAAHAAELRSEAPFLVRLLNWYRQREEGTGESLSLERRPEAYSLSAGLTSPTVAAEPAKAASPFLAVAPEVSGDSRQDGDSRMSPRQDTLLVSFLASLPYGAVSSAQAAAAAQKARRDAALARFLSPKPPGTSDESAPACRADAEARTREERTAEERTGEERTGEERPHAVSAGPAETGGRSACSRVEDARGEAAAEKEGDSSRLGEEAAEEKQGEAEKGALSSVGETVMGRKWREPREEDKATDISLLLDRYSFGGPVAGLTVLHNSAERGTVDVCLRGVFLGTRPGRGRPDAGAANAGEATGLFTCRQTAELREKQGRGERKGDRGEEKAEHGDKKGDRGEKCEEGQATGSCEEKKRECDVQREKDETEKSVAAARVSSRSGCSFRDCEAEGPASRETAEGSPVFLSRVFLGKASWSPGQLEREIEKGAWVVVGCTDSGVMQEIVFGREPSAPGGAPGGHTPPSEEHLWRRVLSALAANPASGPQAGLFEAMSRWPSCLARETNFDDSEDDEDLDAV